MIENKDIKASTNRDTSKYEMNRVVVETYVSTKTVPNNYEDDNFQKILNIQNKDNNCDEVVPTPSYSICQENNINLIYHIKKFDLPLSTTNSSLNYLMQIQKKDNNSDKSKTSSFRKNFVISRSNIFIGGNQNLKGMNLHLIESKKYNNTIHKEITNTKNNKNIENIEINSNESKRDEKEKNKNPLEVLELMKKRWKEAEKEYRMRLSFTSNNETVLINKKKYMDDLLNKININSNSNNFQEYYILIKPDKKSKKNKYIHQIIVPSSKKELEESVNEFLTNSNNNDSKEAFEYSIERVNKRTSQNIIIMNNNNNKKKSKFNTNNNKKNEILIKNKEENHNDISNSLTDIQINKEEFCPIFILNKEQIENIFKNLETKCNKKVDKAKN